MNLLATSHWPLATVGLPFIPGWNELRPFIADLWLIGTIVAVLITPFFVQRSNVACALVALAGVTLAFASQLVVAVQAHKRLELVHEYFRGLLVADPVGFLWKLV